MLHDLDYYQPPDSSLWQGRKDSLPGERFFQRVQCLDLRSEPLANTKKQNVIVGFCSDEGIRRNEGRTGARSGPEKLRTQLARLACHTKKHFFDLGDVMCADEKLEAAQANFAKLIDYSHTQGCKTIAFGGGHEIAWGHFRGLAAHYPKLGIINIDAHFDIRPVSNAQGTSGTPFWQINEYCQQNGLPFNYCCLGIQPTANTKSLFERAHDWDIAYLTAEEINEERFSAQTAFLDEFMSQHKHLYLSICLDAFAECFAPGVSAPQPLGLTPWKALPLLKYIVQTGKVVSLDIAELSPPLDLGDRTARLAAIMLAELL
ncbi:MULTISPECIES: formimidoylglutamase [Legionella]|uniref:Formimidoylglutamase n=1 Tax=Legionella septentrionalis TaxID=2498109 RepID=A0A3S0VBZ0_9GAMM|nr:MULTISPECIES: formimidoylglutamase [Legionella]MCP0913038.1 formimidoylglutamase [Legionella sp. 27cVA30]RUQ91494.1 formimidoylglutamase [Legionella septentrionalis]RUQ98533.1 formimidoylglutamase [Legionella septentrionalis]RUR10886.1 formimidoylglutamase [Legionella septentrionalis]RUR14580.1 formimidoylglutamase [Legionella septentrionalis]